MNWIDLIKLSFSNLWRRKLRSSLTLLGVMIGTASIVSMLSIGLGQNQAMLDMIESSSSLTTIQVMSNYNMYDMYGGQEDSDAPKLNRSTLDFFKQIPNVSYVSPVLNLELMLKQGSYENYVTLQGLSSTAIEAKQLYISQGEMPDFSLASDHLPILLGQDIVNNFYNTNSQNWEPVAVDLINQSCFATIQDYSANFDENIPPKKHIFHVDGIMGTESEEFWSEDLYSAYTEIGQLETFLQQNYKGKAWPGQPASKSGKPLGDVIYNGAIIGSNDLNHTKDIMEEINNMGFMAVSDIEFIDSMREQAATQQLVLGGIGAISLFVAAIGIANTMMMSVYERTKEIGIFKVLGCSLKNIGNIFLCEAALLGLIGGILGISLSFLISGIINLASGSSIETLGIYGMEGKALSVIPIWLVLGAITFAMLIGILAGILPARRAMKLSALEAIRN